MMEIHKTFKVITTQYTNEPAHIFTDCINVLYLLKNHITHPSLHNNHPDKTILTSMVEMLQNRTQLTTLHKFHAHVNTEGNEKADELAKLGRVKDHRIAKHPYEHAHATPIYFQKDDWPIMASTPDKGPVRFLDKYLKRLNLSNNLELIENHIPNVKI